MQVGERGVVLGSKSLSVLGIFSLEVQCAATEKYGLFTQMVSKHRFDSNLLQVMSRPSSYCIPVRKCVAPVILEI